MNEYIHACIMQVKYDACDLIYYYAIILYYICKCRLRNV